jgi:DNA-directed RNA polymerase subunit N (RpoN/RPB10)
MTTTIRCAVCGQAITEHYHVFDHVTCTPPAPSPQAQQDAEQAFQVMRDEFLEVQRTLHQDQGRR